MRASLAAFLALMAMAVCATVAAQARNYRVYGGGPLAGVEPEEGVPGLINNPLIPRQIQEIADIRRREELQVTQVCADAALTGEQQVARIDQIRDSAHQQIMNVLTPAQQAEFSAWWQARAGRGVVAVAPVAVTPSAPAPEAAQAGAGPPVVSAAGLPGLVRNPLTPTQQQTQMQVAAIQANPNITPDQKAGMIEQVAQDERGQILGVLTPQQMTEFNNYWQVGSAPAGAGAGPSGCPVSILGVQQYPLTTQQQACISAIRQQTAQRLQALQSNTALTNQQRATMIGQVQTSERQQIYQVLTPLQRQEFMTYWGVTPVAGGAASGSQVVPGVGGAPGTENTIPRPGEGSYNVPGPAAPAGTTTAPGSP